MSRGAAIGGAGVSAPAAGAQRSFTLADIKRRRTVLPDLSQKLGIGTERIEVYISGKRTPAPWVQQELAAALGVEPAAIWPQTGGVGSTLRRSAPLTPLVTRTPAQVSAPFFQPKMADRTEGQDGR